MSTGPVTTTEAPEPKTPLEQAVHWLERCSEADRDTPISPRGARELLRRLRHLEQELREVDETLARRPALAGRPTRRSKIEFLVQIAIEAESLKSHVEGVVEDLGGLIASARESELPGHWKLSASAKNLIDQLQRIPT